MLLLKLQMYGDVLKCMCLPVCHQGPISVLVLSCWLRSFLLVAFKKIFFKEVVIKVEGMAVATLFAGHSITTCK